VESVVAVEVEEEEEEEEEESSLLSIAESLFNGVCTLLMHSSHTPSLIHLLSYTLSHTPSLIHRLSHTLSHPLTHTLS
jgi:hypothetical protein